jgi:hypothetical protein
VLDAKAEIERSIVEACQKATPEQLGALVESWAKLRDTVTSEDRILDLEKKSRDLAIELDRLNEFLMKMRHDFGNN